MSRSAHAGVADNAPIKAATKAHSFLTLNLPRPNHRPQVFVRASERYSSVLSLEILPLSCIKTHQEVRLECHRLASASGGIYEDARCIKLEMNGRPELAAVKAFGMAAIRSAPNFEACEFVLNVVALPGRCR